MRTSYKLYDLVTQQNFLRSHTLTKITNHFLSKVTSFG